MYQPDYVAKYLERSRQPDFDISIIRKELTRAGVPDDEIRRVVRAVDDSILARNDKKSKPLFSSLSPGLTKVIGILFILLGLFSFIQSVFVRFSVPGLVVSGGSLFYGISCLRRSRSKGLINRRNSPEPSNPLMWWRF